MEPLRDALITTSGLVVGEGTAIT